MGDTVGGWVDAACVDIGLVVDAGVTTGADQADLDLFADMRQRLAGKRAVQGAHELDPIRRLWDWSRQKVEMIKIMTQQNAMAAAASQATAKAAAQDAADLAALNKAKK